MFVMDMPDLPPQYAQVMIVQAGTAKQGTAANVDRTIGVCHLIDARPELRDGAVNHFNPLRAVDYYFVTAEQRFLGRKGTVTLLQGPQHGTLEMGTLGGFYRPATGYLGPDSATFLVEIGGLKVKAVYYFKVMSGVPGGTEGYDPYRDKDLCPNGEHWKISLSSDLDTDPLASPFPTQRGSFLTSAVPNANLSLAELAGGAVGQTTANTITLDTDAAGYGWFVDSTPYDNEEFVRTSNPNEWVATHPLAS